MQRLRTVIACSLTGLLAIAGAVLIASAGTSALSLLDDFNDNTRNPDLWVENEDGISTITETNQRLEFLHPATGTGEFGVAYWGECSISGDFSVQVDFDLCESNALCMAAAPEVFEVRDDDFLYVLDETPPEDLRGKVVEAAQRCPKQAITIVDT